MKILLGFLLLFSQTVFADSTLLMSTEAGNDENEINIKNGELRFVIRSGGKIKQLSLYSKKDQKLVFLNQKNKSFIVIDGQTIKMQKAFKAQQKKAMAQRLKQNLHKMTAEQRVKAHQLINQSENKNSLLNRPIIEFEATGQVVKVSTYSCEKIEVYIDKELSKELCLADAKSLKMDLHDFTTLTSFFTFMKTINGQADATAIPDLKGIPIATTDLIGGKSSGLQSISYKKLSEDLFKVPANFRQVYLK